MEDESRKKARVCFYFYLSLFLFLLSLIPIHSTTHNNIFFLSSLCSKVYVSVFPSNDDYDQMTLILLSLVSCLSDLVYASIVLLSQRKVVS